jgi:hypothetical protein
MDGHDLVQLSGQRHGAMIWGRFLYLDWIPKTYYIYMKPKNLKTLQSCLFPNSSIVNHAFQVRPYMATIQPNQPIRYPHRSAPYQKQPHHRSINGQQSVSQSVSRPSPNFFNPVGSNPWSQNMIGAASSPALFHAFSSPPSSLVVPATSSNPHAR